MPLAYIDYASSHLKYVSILSLNCSLMVLLFLLLYYYLSRLAYIFQLITKMFFSPKRVQYRLLHQHHQWMDVNIQCRCVYSLIDEFFLFFSLMIMTLYTTAVYILCALKSKPLPLNKKMEKWNDRTERKQKEVFISWLLKCNCN